MNREPAKKTENNLIKVLSYTLDRVKELADANSVLGEKIEINGTTIIPVSKISAGFAGGGADLIDANKKKRNMPVGSGGNVTVTPLTFLVIDSDGVNVININQEEKKNSTVADAIKAVMEQMRISKEEKARKKAEDKAEE